MASLAGATTCLGLGGLLTAAPLFDAEFAASPRPYTQTFTKLGLGGMPAPYAIDFTGKVSITEAAVDGTDTWLVSWIEADVDLQEIESSDTWRVTWTETANIVRRYEATDDWTIAWTESVELAISGVTLKTGTDTWSASWTEAVTLSVTLDATDTWTVDWSEAGALDVVGEQITATDTWSVSFTEDVLLNIFTGLITRTGDDTWAVSWSESGEVLARTPVDPLRIRIIPRPAQIRIVPI